MATKVEGLIQKVNPGDGVKYSIASTAYGYCQTAAATAAKVVDMTGFTLLEGTTIHVKFQYANTAANPTLNVNGTGAKNIVLYGTEKAGTTAETSGWQAGAVVSLTYDGTSWVRDQGYNTNTTSDNTKVAKTGDTMSGSLTMSKNGEIGVEVENTAQAHKVAYIVGSSGNGGIYDRTHSKWIVYSTTAGHVELNGHAGSATYAASALNATHSSSAGYAASAARATYAMSAASAGYAASAAQATHATSANYAANATNATEAVHAATAGYASSAGYANVANSANTSGTSSWAVTAGNAKTALTATEAVHAASAGYAASALNATHAASAGYALYSASAGYALHSSSAGYAASAAQATHAASAGYALKSGSAGYAASAAQATHAASAGYAEFVGKGSHTAVVAANEFTPSVGSLTIVGNVNNTSMSHTNNANAEMIIKTHPTSGTNYYEARLGFSGNGSLYYMPVNTTTWKTIAYTTSDITGKSGSAGYAASAAQATHAASAGYAVSASQATHSASAGYASSAARATYAAKAALTTTTGAVAFYSDAAGTFANDADFLWDATNNKLTAANLNGYVMAGQKTGTTLGSKATAEGNNTTASGTNSHAEGNYTTASGTVSHAEGNYTTASENSSHAEGYQTTASGKYSHAEGHNTTASKTSSHAEGFQTTASGYASHAEGYNTIASGSYSHAEGNYTTAQRYSQHVFGEYNILDTTGTTNTRGIYIEIVGNGTATTSSNARTLDWNGNEWLAGGLTTPKLIGSGETLYGETLPETGSEGQVFFQLSDGYIYELPTGGAVDEMLVKNSATDRDVKWTRDYVKRTGDTMSGDLIVSKASGNVDVAAQRSDVTNGKVALQFGSGGTNHGVWSYVAGKWIIYCNGTSANTGMQLYGAVWNDYAEFRETQEDIEPGRCIRELGNDTLELTTERLERGCEIVSDTFGFAIGQSEKAKTPTAASGRVLAYLYEDRELAKEKIGWPVCSGPNGTVSIMTEEEEQKYPSRIIGTISAVPDYEVWYGGNDGDAPIQVNGRIWIRIR